MSSHSRQRLPIHARNHLAGGDDPIPNLLPQVTGSFAERILSYPSLVGYWPMNDPSGDAHDESGNSQPLSPVGTPVYGQTGPFTDSPADTSILVTGTDSTGSPADDSFAGSYPALNVAGGDMTVMSFIYPTAYPTLTGGITFFGSGPDPSHLVQIRSTGRIYWSVASSEQAQTTLTVPLSTWTHVACTRDSTGLYIYFNGVLVATDTSEAIHDSATNVFRVGVGISAANDVYYFQGRVAQVALFNAALTESEIAGIATAPGVATGEEGSVLTLDEDGNPVWADPTIRVDGTRYQEILAGTNLTATDNLDGTVTLDATGGDSFDPATATTWWFPLADSDGLLVLDGDGALIPTLIPL